MGREQRGVRDGSGPYGGGEGRRKAAGLPCPVKKSKSNNKRRTK